MGARQRTTTTTDGCCCFICVSFSFLTFSPRIHTDDSGLPGRPPHHFLLHSPSPASSNGLDAPFFSSFSPLLCFTRTPPLAATTHGKYPPTFTQTRPRSLASLHGSGTNGDQLSLIPSRSISFDAGSLPSSFDLPSRSILQSKRSSKKVIKDHHGSPQRVSTLPTTLRSPLFIPSLSLPLPLDLTASPPLKGRTLPTLPSPSLRPPPVRRSPSCPGRWRSSSRAGQTRMQGGCSGLSRRRGCGEEERCKERQRKREKT